MKYMLLIGGREDTWDNLSQEEQQALYERVAEWWNAHEAAGRIVEGYQLQPSSTATTVRRDRDGNVTVTDGPFVEGKEMIGGYGIIDVPDLDAAIELASGWPGPDTLEIRPLMRQ